MALWQSSVIPAILRDAADSRGRMAGFFARLLLIYAWEQLVVLPGLVQDIIIGQEAIGP